MASFDVPSISISDKTNEQNMQVVKSYLSEMADKLNYEINVLQDAILALQEEIDQLKGDN